MPVATPESNNGIQLCDESDNSNPPIQNDRDHDDDIEEDVDEPCLIVSSTHSFLGASLDCIVKHGKDSWGLKIKCPYSKFSSSLLDAVADKKIF